ncbi:hypothetical protein TNCV_3025961 [Trichonephila clavipes]|nr:hypothetical protein TNCV_3025961 [Trichonephila clavipes]
MVHRSQLPESSAIVSQLSIDIRLWKCDDLSQILLCHLPYMVDHRRRDHQYRTSHASCSEGRVIILYVEKVFHGFHLAVSRRTSADKCTTLQRR